MQNSLSHGVILDLDSLHPRDLDLSALRATLPRWDFHAAASAADGARCLQDADIAIANKFIIDAALLARTPKLKLICVAATGTNNIDLDETAARGIAVCNVTAYATASVVEHVFALILSLQRRLAEQQHAAHTLWPHQHGFSVLDYPTSELHGKQLGIIGHGELGSAVAAVGKAFGMQVLIAQRDASDDRAGRLPLNEVLALADVVSVHCPLTDATRGLIGAREMTLMKSTALLINTARGGIVDEAALLYALQHNRIGGAGVDVLTEEPPRHSNPLLLHKLPNLIVTPHVAWASREARQRLVNELTANVQAYMNGQARNLISTI